MLYGRISFRLPKSLYYIKSTISTPLIRKYSRRSSARNPYDVLGVKSNCSAKDIKKAYIKLCKELHPDKKPDDTTQHKKFVELNNAYTALINESSRRQVDESLKNPFKAQGTSSPHNPFYYKNTSGPYTETDEKDIPWYERDAYKKQNEEYFYRQRQNAHVKFRAKQNSVLYGCFLLVVIGCVLYYSAFCYGRYVLKKVDDRSKKIKEDYDVLRLNSMKRREGFIENLKEE